jgi:hypothetical protein
MSTPVVNNILSTDAYQEVVFTARRPGFSVIVSNKAITYQCAYPGASGASTDYVWESIEHQLVPSLSSFNDPAKEGYPGVSLFSGFRFKSAAVGVPGRVSVN